MITTHTAPDADEVLVAIEDGIAMVTLNRPAQMNAVNSALRRRLITVLGALDADQSVGAIVLTGAGERAFCAGQDLSEAAALTTPHIEPWLREQRAMYQAVRDLDKPCVTAVRGVAAGAGFQIALCSDWRVTTADSRWGQPEVKAGLASIVGTFLMTLHVGHTHNVQMSFSGELISGQRAYDIGLVTQLCTTETLMTEAIQRARTLAALPATAVRVSKQRIREVTQAGFDDACEAGLRGQLACFASGEPQAVIARFLARR